jgi:hypothetical protein
MKYIYGIYTIEYNSIYTIEYNSIYGIYTIEYISKS